MKRKWMAVAALIVVAIIALLVIALGKDDGPPVPHVETWFESFTNTPDGPAARVAVHLRPGYQGAQWTSPLTYRQKADQWELWFPSPEIQRRPYDALRYHSPLPGGPDGKTIAFHYAFAVANTNDPWRFVLEVRENRRANAPWLWRVRAYWNQWRNVPPPPWPFDGPHYFLTNETSKVN